MNEPIKHYNRSAYTTWNMEDKAACGETPSNLVLTLDLTEVDCERCFKEQAFQVARNQQLYPNLAYIFGMSAQPAS